MNNENVLNHFKRPGPDNDNELFIGGSSAFPSGSTVNIPGNWSFSAQLDVDDLTVGGDTKLATGDGEIKSVGAGQVLGTREVTVELPNIDIIGAARTIFPKVAGVLHKVTGILQGNIGGGSPTIISFEKFVPPAGSPVSIPSASLTIGVGQQHDSTYSADITSGDARNFTAGDALRVKSNGAAVTGASLMVTFQFLIV